MAPTVPSELLAYCHNPGRAIRQNSVKISVDLDGAVNAMNKCVGCKETNSACHLVSNLEIHEPRETHRSIQTPGS